MAWGQPPSFSLGLASDEVLAAWSPVVGAGLLGGGLAGAVVVSVEICVSGAIEGVEGEGVEGEVEPPVDDERDLLVLAALFDELFAGLLGATSAEGAALVSAAVVVVTALSFAVTALSSATFALATFMGGEVFDAVGAGRGAVPDGVMV